MTRKKSRTFGPVLSQEEFNEVTSEVLSRNALKAMQNHKDGLAAAIVYCSALGAPFPEWVRDGLAAQQLLATISGRRRRQQHLRHKQELFIKDLLRYECVYLFEGVRYRQGNDKVEVGFEKIEGLWFAPRDSSGLKKSYYRFQRMFGSRLLSRYVANRVVYAWKNREVVP